MNISIQLSAHEAYLVASCLDFVRKNLVFDERTGSRRFVGGDQFALLTRDVFDIAYLSAKLNELREDSINYHPFNPFIKVN